MNISHVMDEDLAVGALPALECRQLVIASGMFLAMENGP